MSTNREQNIFIGMKGTVIALDRLTGTIVWQTPLKGYQFVNLAIDNSDLVAITRGEVFCLDPATGRIRWNNPMKGFGYGYATIATAGGSPLALIAEQQQQQEHVTSNGSIVT